MKPAIAIIPANSSQVTIVPSETLAPPTFS